MNISADLLVIGGGMAGLVAGTIATEHGLETVLLRKGQSATAFSSGAVDVIGYLPEATAPFTNPEEGLAAIAGLYPLHPYSVVGYGEDVSPEQVVNAIISRTKRSIDWLREKLSKTLVPLVGDFSSNIYPITVLGTTKPTCLIQQTMDQGDLEENEDCTLLFAGIKGFPDFNAATAAKTYLEDRVALSLPPRRVAHCDIQITPFGRPHNISPIEIARHLDHEDGLEEFATQLKHQTERVGATHVAIPPILGLRNAVSNQTKLKGLLSAHVFELLGFPPSIPGLRLQLALEQIFLETGGKLLVGHEAISYSLQNGVVESVLAKAPKRAIGINAKTIILASGKFIGGGLTGDVHGIHETVFGLMTVTGSYHSAENILPSRATNRMVLTPEGHPVYSTGLTVDPNFRPIQEDGTEWARNLFAAGSILGGYNYSVEKSGLGVALSTGFSAALNACDYVKGVFE